MNLLPLEYSGEEENDLDVPTLNTTDSDKKENDTDVPPLTSTDNGEVYSNPELTPLPKLYNDEEVKIRNDMSVTYCGSTLVLVIQVRKFFEGLGWFSEEVVDDFLDRENNHIHTIRFTDDKEKHLLG